MGDPKDKLSNARKGSNSFSVDKVGSVIKECIGDLKAFGELAMLCSLLCQCLGRGNQKCVEAHLYAMDAALQGESTLLPEIPYNMRVSPPRPMMSTKNQKKGAQNWRFPNHPEHPVGFKPRAGHVFRPDVVIVDNPTEKPGGKNLRAVVEMKFPGDPWDSKDMARRERAYRKIASGNNPRATYVRLDAKKCGCSEGKRSPAYQPVAIPAREPEKPTQISIPAPSPGALIGAAEVLTGLAMMIAGAVATGALVADDATGIGTADDVLIPATAGLSVRGTATFYRGATRIVRSLR